MTPRLVTSNLRRNLCRLPAHSAHHAPQGFIRKYVFSLDHKVIGIQYYFLGLFSVFVGMALSLLMRFHMVYPDAKVALVRQAVAHGRRTAA